MSLGHEPDVGAAVARFVPEHVAGAVGVEVSGAGGLPAERMQPDIDAAGPLAILDFPGLGVAVARIITEHIGRAVIVEIAARGKNPPRGMRPDIDTARPASICHLP